MTAQFLIYWILEVVHQISHIWFDIQNIGYNAILHYIMTQNRLNNMWPVFLFRTFMVWSYVWPFSMSRCRGCVVTMTKTLGDCLFS